MQITQRQSVIGLLGLVLVGGLLVIVLQLLYNQPLDQEIVTGVGLLIAYWRGWDHARHAVVVIVTLLLAATMTEPFLTQQVTYSILIPPVIALVFTRPAWILGSAAVVLLGLIARGGGLGSTWTRSPSCSTSWSSVAWCSHGLCWTPRFRRLGARAGSPRRQRERWNRPMPGSRPRWSRGPPSYRLAPTSRRA